ncbi:MAG: PadR family transcriptional regulator [Candidatus Bathyarchaeota archaeon]|nr:PadR family transcriptional regulator [Candidatus Bathyarchaeum sp.]
MRKQIIKSVMDLLMLAELRNGTMSGYDAIGFIHNKFGVLVSSGTVYSHLYSLERDGLVTGTWEVKKRVYAITEKGEQALENVAKANKELIDTLKSILDY